jgi:catabolite regulation protein CreA
MGNRPIAYFVIKTKIQAIDFTIIACNVESLRKSLTMLKCIKNCSLLFVVAIYSNALCTPKIAIITCYIAFFPRESIECMFANISASREMAFLFAP